MIKSPRVIDNIILSAISSTFNCSCENIFNGKISILLTICPRIICCIILYRYSDYFTTANALIIFIERVCVFTFNLVESSIFNIAHKEGKFFTIVSGYFKSINKGRNFKLIDISSLFYGFKYNRFQKVCPSVFAILIPIIKFEIGP